MTSREIYLGPDFRKKVDNKPPKVIGGYSVIEQSLGFGVPREQLKGPASGLSPEEWEKILRQSH